MSPNSAAARRIEFLHARRLEAAALFEKGASQAEVVRRLGVTSASACRWHQSWKRKGAKGLRMAGWLGRQARLREADLDRLARALKEGPTRHGFETELWTLPRIGKVIEELFGVRYHDGHVWKVMRRLGWSLQRPTTRARERDEAAVAQWVSQTWPELRKKGVSTER
jgi:transposase